MQSLPSKLPAAVGVRPGYRDEDTWRAALGPSEPLRCFAALEPTLDAPETLPAGAMRSSAYGPHQLAASRFGG